MVATPFVEEPLSKGGHYHYNYHDHYHYHYHETRVFPLSVLSGSDIVIEMRRQKTKVEERALIHPRRVEAKSKKHKVYSYFLIFCNVLHTCVMLFQSGTQTKP